MRPLSADWVLGPAVCSAKIGRRVPSFSVLLVQGVCLLLSAPGGLVPPERKIWKSQTRSNLSPAHSGARGPAGTTTFALFYALKLSPAFALSPNSPLRRAKRFGLAHRILPAGGPALPALRRHPGGHGGPPSRSLSHCLTPAPSIPPSNSNFQSSIFTLQFPQSPPYGSHLRQW
jgi:hypothetical protein